MISSGRARGRCGGDGDIAVGAGDVGHAFDLLESFQNGGGDFLFAHP
jgi:hypothetical protein